MASHFLGLCLLSHESRSGRSEAIAFHVGRPKGQSGAEEGVAFAMQAWSLSLIPRAQVRMPVPGSVIPALGRQKQLEPWSSLAIQPVQIRESHGSEGPASKKKKIKGCQ